MVHFREMRYLMGNDIIEHWLRNKNQPPAKRDISVSRAAAPPALCIAYAYPLYFAADLCRHPPGTRRELVPRRDDEVVADPAC